MSNLAEATLPTSEKARDELRVPDRAKVALTESLEDLLHREYVGHKITVRVPGYGAWSQVLTGLAATNGQLQLIFADSTVLPYSRLNFLEKAKS
jgi:hypothetical protein